MVERLMTWAHWARPRVKSSFQQARTRLVLQSCLGTQRRGGCGGRWHSSKPPRVPNKLCHHVFAEGLWNAQDCSSQTPLSVTALTEVPLRRNYSLNSPGMVLSQEAAAIKGLRARGWAPKGRDTPSLPGRSWGCSREEGGIYAQDSTADAPRDNLSSSQKPPDAVPCICLKITGRLLPSIPVHPLLLAPSPRHMEKAQ